MLSLLTLSLLAADPLVVVGPFDVVHIDKSLAPLSRGMQSLLEFELRANGVAVRTDDQLDSANWGQIKGATHFAVGSILSIGGQKLISLRVVTVDKVVLGVAKTKSFKDREQLIQLVLQHTGIPLPPAIKLLRVDEELLLAWGAALVALHDGAPADAKKKVAEVAAKWPDFTPAQERLKQL